MELLLKDITCSFTPLPAGKLPSSFTVIQGMVLQSSSEKGNKEILRNRAQEVVGHPGDKLGFKPVFREKAWPVL